MDESLNVPAAADAEAAFSRPAFGFHKTTPPTKDRRKVVLGGGFVSLPATTVKQVICHEH
jgi:hypothetical protein